ncbi:hypothetical protein IW261DRAFT_1412902 [Armillaria novae-zelandiae]|uniref:Fungal-type protein kinase domain-containing protein n=1 Tax=Armillaria novae-zelandiae TaxID=153914 RepID=A0AA39PUM5_9AGAR|nr:hypothetical protein IW261DRAFT_1412902 [Armillaria novae-zelandiae]
MRKHANYIPGWPQVLEVKQTKGAGDTIDKGYDAIRLKTKGIVDDLTKEESVVLERHHQHHGFVSSGVCTWRRDFPCRFPRSEAQKGAGKQVLLKGKVGNGWQKVLDEEGSALGTDSAEKAWQGLFGRVTCVICTTSTEWGGRNLVVKISWPSASHKSEQEFPGIVSLPSQKPMEWLRRGKTHWILNHLATILHEQDFKSHDDDSMQKSIAEMVNADRHVGGRDGTYSVMLILRIAQLRTLHNLRLPNQGLSNGGKLLDNRTFKRDIKDTVMEFMNKDFTDELRNDILDGWRGTMDYSPSDDKDKERGREGDDEDQEGIDGDRLDVERDEDKLPIVERVWLRMTTMVLAFLRVDNHPKRGNITTLLSVRDDSIPLRLSLSARKGWSSRWNLTKNGGQERVWGYGNAALKVWCECYLKRRLIGNPLHGGGMDPDSVGSGQATWLSGLMPKYSFSLTEMIPHCADNASRSSIACTP